MKRIFTLIILSTAFFSACGGSQWVRTPVVKDRDFVITLEQREEKGSVITGKYSHPHEIAPVDLAKLMSDLTYIEKVGILGKESIIPVFQAIEIERLAPSLSDALKTADNNQRVRFTSYNRGKALFFSTSRETEGVVFVAPDNRLNLAFSKINSEIDPNTANTFPEDFSRIDPIGIKNADTVLSPVPPYGKLVRMDTGDEAPMWIAADLDALKQTVAKAPAMIPPPATTVQMGSEPPAAVSAPQQTPPKAATPASPAPTETSDAWIQEDIKNKLKYLKELLDDGLISEKDYDAKKIELLEKIH